MELRRRVACGPAEFVREGVLLRVPVLPAFHFQDDAIGRVRSTGALVARRNGVIYAYANVCRHIPLTLDLGDGEVSTADGKHFLCHHHGARYRVEDGTCEFGPCDGDSLVPLGVEVIDGELYLVLPREPIEVQPA